MPPDIAEKFRQMFRETHAGHTIADRDDDFDSNERITNGSDG